MSNVSSRGCVAAQATTDHWQWPGAGSTNKVDQDKSVGQNSELFLVPNCLLSPTRPQLPGNELKMSFDVLCSWNLSLPRSDCVKPSSIILFVVQHAAIRCDASAECRLKGISVHRAAAPSPGLASLAWRGHEWGHRVTVTGYPDWASVSVSPCPLYPHTTRPSPVSGGGEIKISWYLHTHSIQHHQQRRTADR